MHCRLLTPYAIIMVQFLAGLRKIKLHSRRLDVSLVRMIFPFDNNHRVMLNETE